jgi:hypothetical protein
MDILFFIFCAVIEFISEMLYYVNVICMVWLIQFFRYLPIEQSRTSDATTTLCRHVHGGPKRRYATDDGHRNGYGWVDVGAWKVKCKY